MYNRIFDAEVASGCFLVPGFCFRAPLMSHDPTEPGSLWDKLNKPTFTNSHFCGLKGQGMELCHF